MTSHELQVNPKKRFHPNAHTNQAQWNAVAKVVTPSAMHLLLPPRLYRASSDSWVAGSETLAEVMGAESGA